MPKKTGTAREFVLQTLRQYADRELQVADLYDLAGDRFTKDNLSNLMPKLLAEGLVVRTTDGRSAWWAIAPAGLTGSELEQPAPAPKPKRTSKPTATQRGPEPQAAPASQQPAASVAPPVTEPEPVPVPAPGPAPASDERADSVKQEASAQPAPAPEGMAGPAMDSSPHNVAPRGVFGYARAWAGRIIRRHDREPTEEA